VPSKMPVVIGLFDNSLRGQFETSLRGQDSPSPDKKLHKGCSGHSHGNSVKKERPSRPLPVNSKDCCYNDGSSSDESNHPRRSQSSEYTTRLSTPITRRSTSASNSAVAQRLFNSPTKAVTAKYRAERTASDGVKMAADMKAIKTYNSNSLPRRRINKSAEEDSGNFSSSEENTDGRFVDLVTPTPVKQNLIHGTSDDELSIQELRRKQRQQRRDYLNLKNSGDRGSRRESPSPVKRGDLQCNETRGSRRSSDDASDSSYSPPASPLMTFRSSSNKIWQRSPIPGKPRARSSGTNSCVYAFGSSTKRFVDDKNKKLNNLPSPLHKSSSDGVQNGLKAAELALRRTYSDPRQREKQEITKAWLKFKEDIEAAMQKKPNTGGYYKNLADMMTTKMEMLAEEVGSNLSKGFSICPGNGFLVNFLGIALYFRRLVSSREKDIWFAILALSISVLSCFPIFCALAQWFSLS